MPTNAPGRIVLERARRGDERAFEALVDAYGGLVLNLAWRVVRDRQEAEDLSQEVFLRLYRVLDRYDPDRPFEPWLKKVAMNLVLNLTSGKARRMRRRSASLQAVEGEDGGRLPDTGSPDAEETAIRGERAALLRDAMRRLSTRHRKILAMRYFRGLSYQELARELSLPMGTVKNRLFRAREELARVLEKRIEPDAL
ncbi:MAG: RNA polymerase sigma factor [Planctomycetota bacterium]|jgi:RNA polymerase sigma-70 factor (ECF subfamily)